MNPTAKEVSRAPGRSHARLGTLVAGIAVGLAAPPLLRLARQAGAGAFIGAETQVFARALRARPSWYVIVSRTVEEFVVDEIPTVAAGATFYALLALFPALAAFVSLYGLFADVEDARRQVVALNGILPAGAVAVIVDQLTRLAAINHARLGLGFAATLLVSIWSANAGVKALMRGLNVAFELKERRGFFVLNATSLALTLGAIVFAMAAIAAVVAAPETLSWLRLDQLAFASLARWPALLVMAMGLAAILYRYGPSQRGPTRWLTLGAGLAGAGWLFMSGLFSWIVANFGHFDRTYGSLGAIVGFVTWIWISIMVMLAGAELDRELERSEPERTAIAA
jgi:membrane protein